MTESAMGTSGNGVPVPFEGLPDQGGRILVVKLSSMGDVVHALPALAALRRGRPKAHIGWVVEEEAAPVVRGHPSIDRLHVVPRRRWARYWMRPQNLLEVASLVRELREARYDVAIDLQGLLRSAVVAVLSGAPHVVGPLNAREGASLFYDRAVPISGGAHAIDRYILVSRAVGAHSSPPEVRPAPIGEEATRRARAFLTREGLTDRPFAVVLPGAGKRRNRWPPGRWATVIDQLAEAGLRTCLAGGPRDQGLARFVAGEVRGPRPANACGALDILSYRVLAQASRVVLGSDTGPLHLAAADGCPVVAIFGAADPRRTGPRSVNGVPARVILGCRVYEGCRNGRGHQCMDRIQPEAVVAGAIEVVRR